MSFFTLSDWFTIEQKVNANHPADIGSLREIVNELMKHIDVKMILKQRRYFRAREIDPADDDKSCLDGYKTGFYGYDAQKSSAPPSKDAKAGRANTKHCPVLYLAEDPYTALAELRPGKRVNISIAEFEILENLNVPSFQYSEKPYPNDLNGFILKPNHWEYLWNRLSLAFYMPVNNDNEYHITQGIAKCIKELGYDGVEYNSSLSANGTNLVIFDPNKARALNSKRYQTHAVLYYAEEVLPRQNNEKLVPKSITEKFTDDHIDSFLSKF